MLGQQNPGVWGNGRRIQACIVVNDVLDTIRNATWPGLDLEHLSRINVQPTTHPFRGTVCEEVLGPFRQKMMVGIANMKSLASVFRVNILTRKMTIFHEGK